MAENIKSVSELKDFDFFIPNYQRGYRWTETQVNDLLEDIKNFNETDETVNLKLKASLNEGLKPIVCVGETLEQREANETEKVITSQVEKATLNLTNEEVKNTIIAYEPIWAIGTGKTATSQQAEEICAAIRQVIKELYGDKTAEVIRIQYGGSVNGKNADEIFAMENIDGGLVGGASLKEEFAQIVNY